MDPLLTRRTLLLRIREPDDGGAWTEFVSLYEPLLRKYVLLRGVPLQDVQDVVQEVLKTVTQAIRKFEYDAERGTFRDWLFIVCRSHVGKYRRRHRADNTKLPGVRIAKIIRFWGSGADQLLLQVQLTGTGVNRSNNQAFLLRQGDGVYRVLMRTGQPAPSTGNARLASISAIEVNPVTGRYAVLGTLSGTTSATNQALWTGHSQAGDNTTTLSALRFPTLAFRKGTPYQTESTPSGLIRGLSLRPAPDSTGAGSRGLGQTMSANGELAFIITADLGVQEVVVLDK
jgi:RNA polymerase sigma factor (sigma-70 family)